MYGATDLGDFYRGSLTLRQILIRIQSAPDEAPIQELLAAQRADAEARRDLHEHDAALAPFNRKE